MKHSQDNPSKDDRRTLRALGDLCNDTISESEARWLAGQLREFPEVRDQYVDYMSMHACISAEVAMLSPAVANSGLLQNGLSQNVDGRDSVEGVARPLSPSAGIGVLIGKSWLTLAASLLFVMLAGAIGYALMAPGEPVVASRGDLDSLPAIARITSTQDCRWGEASVDIGYGSTLRAGQTVQLREGLAEITFEDGATMLLESPATVVFESADKIAMKEGRMAAIFPPDAQRISIHTRTLDLRNVDAEFGLLARDSGASELHVFDGTVEANFLNAAGERREQMEISASEAVMASPTTTTILEFPANETRFVRSMSPTEGRMTACWLTKALLIPKVR